MRVFIVEDMQEQLSIISEKLNAFSYVPELITARSRDSAFRLVDRKDFDLAIIDLKIPTIDDALDLDKNHGMAVLYRILGDSKGVPIIVYSGFGDMTIVQKLLDDARKIDLFNTGEQIEMLSFLTKDELTKLIGKIEKFSREYESIDKISINTGGVTINLNYYEKRILQFFCRRKSGNNITIKPLSGLSSAKTLRVTIWKDGHRNSFGIVKINSIDKVRDEVRRFRKFVTTVLKLGDIVNIGDEIIDGCGNLGAIFYEFADGYNQTLAEFLKHFPKESAEIVKNLKEKESPWATQFTIGNKQVSEIRKSILSDDKLELIKDKMTALDWVAAENRTIQIKEIPQHCDLHCLNILIKNGKESIFIDYGDVNDCFASFDPITLELSILFHPDMSDMRQSWPNEIALSNWKNIDAYLTGCPYPEYIRECRSWAYEVVEGFDEKLVDAIVYSYSIRQLQYPDTNHNFALKLAEQAIHSILS